MKTFEQFTTPSRISKWTREELTRLWHLVDGKAHTAEQIAVKLNDEFEKTLTRNSIIGMCGRGGLRLVGHKSKKKPAKPATAPKDQGVRMGQFPHQKNRGHATKYGNVFQIGHLSPDDRPKPDFRDWTLSEAPGEQLPLEGRCGAGDALYTLGRFQCHWPIGDPLEDDFHFCALPRLYTTSYCEHHTKIAGPTINQLNAYRKRPNPYIVRR